MYYVFTNNVSTKAYGIVFESLRVFQSCTIVTEAVQIPPGQDDNSDLEAAQRDGLDTEDGLAEVVRPVWLQALSTTTVDIAYNVSVPAGFCHVLVPVSFSCNKWWIDLLNFQTIRESRPGANKFVPVDLEFDIRAARNRRDQESRVNDEAMVLKQLE